MEVSHNPCKMAGLPVDEMAASTLVASDAMAKAAGAGGALFISVAAVIATTGTLVATSLTDPRVLFAMARDRLFFDFVGDRQELRVKMQAIGLDAKLKQAWRTLPDGAVVAVADHIDDFSLRNLGFQVRYRHELAPLSDLYVVYSRGGYMLDEYSQGAGNQLRDAFSLRDSEMLLVKLSYRFEL